MGAFIDLLFKAEANKWCLEPHIWRDATEEFRSHLADVPSLADDLRNTAPEELMKAPSWSNGLKMVASEQRRLNLNWDSIFEAWLPTSTNNEVFLDHVFFYVVRNVRCKTETRKNWINVCVSTALVNKSPSLLESLIWVLGSSAKQYSSLVEHARELAPYNSKLNQALEKYEQRLADEVERKIREQQMRRRATHNLRCAIQRRDIKAIEAILLRKKPALYEQDETGIAIVDCAKSSNDKRVCEIFEKYYAVQQP